ncbi:helix-turn-helix transcriptional regulator [Singulisphaera sp. Ch08]|uniref:Helix-turn-helix transcriptional regulator n=1 Tax=Singulisphaera sp. Ch08 TaxID=3120278 RepID=A0AAU7CQ96_9BACT
MELYKKLDLLCRVDGVSRADLAAIAGGVSVSTINNWFSGKTKPDLVAGLRIARQFGVPLEWLADDDNSIFPERYGKSVPSGLGLADDERSVLKTYRSLGITEEDAIRAIALHARAEGLPWEVLKGLNRGGPEARDLAFEIIAIGMERARARGDQEENLEFAIPLIGEDYDRWMRAQNHVKWRFKKPWHREKDEARWEAEEEQRSLEAAKRREEVKPSEQSKEHPPLTAYPRNLVFDPDVEPTDPKK